ncbi:lyase family protein [Nocardioides sp. LHG3406-4]|uniref:lyase family protein n=1 Tax=Nocardioides sp. LHG3406-4 TaxID=2804575 RepID=UPI003CE8AD5A
MSEDLGLLVPGSHRAAGLADDHALVGAMLEVERAWVSALATTQAVSSQDLADVTSVIAGFRPDLAALAAETEAAGNPVVPLVGALRVACDDERLARVVHRGLTSQDVLDTALMLIARGALDRVGSALALVAESLAALADEHRGAVMAGRTLTQYAVPVTFGLKAAQWLAGVLDAAHDLSVVRAGLPVQCGGAAGTLALAGEITEHPVAAAEAFAAELGLRWPGLPWHTRRGPVTRLGDALVTVSDALGVIATDVALLARPEFGEVRERPVPGRGGSSTMPHKQNPVLSVLVRSAALQAPMLGAQLHLASAQAVDERPDGAWHSEWPALRRLIQLTVTATSQSAELVAGLEVDTEVMRQRADRAAADLLAERGTPGDPAAYLGSSMAFVDVVLARMPSEGGRHG